MLESGNAAAREQYGELLRAAQAKLDALRAERAKLSPAQLAEQARVDGTALVEINPALAGGRGRVNLIVVNSFANDEAMKEPLDGAVRAVDYEALRSLLR